MNYLKLHIFGTLALLEFAILGTGVIEKANAQKVFQVVPSIICLPNEPDAQSQPDGAPLSVQEYLQRGDTEIKADRCKAAIADYSQAIKLEPQNVKSYWRRAIARSALAEALFKPKQMNQVIDDLNQAIAIEPNTPQLYLLRGYAYLSLPRNFFSPRSSVKRAYQDFSKVIELQPNNGAAYVGRYVADLGLGDRNQTNYDQRKANLLDSAELAQVDNSVAQGRQEEAVRLMQLTLFLNAIGR